MNKRQYCIIENYMQSCMRDSAHDREHVYRVLYTALRLAQTEQNVDLDVLIAACLLHDIGRREQFENPTLCHAQVGGDKAFDFLTANGFDGEFAARVRECIVTHRFRKNDSPVSIEAKILFDADKIDVVGAIGVARSLAYIGTVGEPLYTLNGDGTVSDGSNTDEPSFFHEYCFKLIKLYDRFFTESGRRLAESRRAAAVNFYDDLLRECSEPNLNGKQFVKQLIED